MALFAARPRELRLGHERRRPARSRSVSCTASHVVILPGLGNAAGDYAELEALLAARLGSSVRTAAVSRADWLRNASGCLDVAYWTGNLAPRPTVDWYMERIEAAVSEAQAESGGSPVALVAHSAGGWMGRVWMAELGGASRVHTFCTLGSPLQPPPEGIPGVIDQTRGILKYVTRMAPGAFHTNVRYICCAGTYVKGARFDDPDASLNAKLIGQGYKQVVGAADVPGDGIAPVAAAHLEGALNLTLDGVYHSPLGSSDLRPWYGSPSIVGKWADHLRAQALLTA